MHVVLRPLQGWTIVLVGALVIIGVVSLSRAIRELRDGDIHPMAQRARWRRIALVGATSVGAFSGALTYVTVGTLRDAASYVLWAMTALILAIMWPRRGSGHD
jgi:hypothetical protein